MKFNYIKNFSIWAIIFIILLAVSFICFNPAQAMNGLSPDFRQVKTADNSAVYYLDHGRGLKKAYINAEAYLSYGNKWEDIKIVSAEELNQFDDVHLVKTADSPAVFYIYNGKKALIHNEEEFLSHGFSWEDIITINPIDLSSYIETDLNDIYVSGSIQVANVNNKGGNLKVSNIALSQDIAQIPLDSVDNLVAAYEFKAYDKIVKINQITIDLKGFFSEDYIDRVYLMINNDINNKYVGYVSGKVVNFYLNNGVVITPESSKIFKIYLDTKYNGVLPKNSNFYVSFKNISTDGNLIGDFSTDAKRYNFVYADRYLGKIKSQEKSLSRDSKIILGNINQEVANFTISEISGNEDVYIQYLILKNIGTARDNDLANFVLKDENNYKIAQVESMNGNKIIFALGKHKIKDFDSKDFRLFADILSGDGRTINFQIDNIKAVGARNNYGLSSDIFNVNEELIITHETISVVSKDLNTSKSISAGKANTNLGVFEIKNNNKNIDLETLNLSLYKSANAPSINRIYAVDYETGNIFDNAIPDDNGNLKFDASGLKVKIKDNMKIVFITDIPESAKQGDSYQLILNSVVYTFDGNTYYNDNVGVQGEKFIVNKSNIYLYGTDNEEDRNFIKGQKGVRIGKFYIEASEGDDAIITSLTFSKANSSGSVTYNNGFSNVKLYINSNKVGNVISRPYSETYEFNNFAYRVKAGERITISVYVDTIKNLKVNQVQLMLTNIISHSYSSNINTSIYGSNVKGYFVNFGEVSATLSAVSGGSVNINQDDNLVGSFKIINTGDEELDLDYITLVTNGKGFSQSLGYTNLTIRENETNKKIGKKSKPVSGANKIKISYDIPVGESKIFNIYVDADNVPEDSFELYFRDLDAHGEESNIDAVISGDPTSSVMINNQGIYINPIQNNTTSSVTTTGSGIDLNNVPIVNIVVGEDNFIRPVKGGYISYGFGADKDDGYKYGVHNGIDIVVPQKTEVYASASGIVSYMVDGGFTDRASYIEIDHNNGFKTRYGHLYEMYVSIGDEVKQGQLIGLSGGIPNTYGAGSTSTGAHLHFDMTYNNSFVDPENYL